VLDIPVEDGTMSRSLSLPAADSASPSATIALSLSALAAEWEKSGSSHVMSRLAENPETRDLWHQTLAALPETAWPELAVCLELLLPELRARKDLLSSASPIGAGIIEAYRREIAQRLLQPGRLKLLHAIAPASSMREAA